MDYTVLFNLLIFISVCLKLETNELKDKLLSNKETISQQYKTLIELTANKRNVRYNLQTKPTDTQINFTLPVRVLNLLLVIVFGDVFELSS